MINPRLLAQAPRYREAFAHARPFKHVVMENFFMEEAMEALYREFPAFQEKHALNEFGEVGGKAVVTDLKQVSPSYERLYAYLNSQAFLDAMSAITGIPDLLPDPQLYGGGTHENVEGQELDPHVDYNYLNGAALHRRLNLLVYFNKEWEESWGGSIELHANPRRPEEDEITAYLPLYNRALVFETNEHSWHGFRKILLPQGKKHLTRRSLAVYLYTRTRPEDEVAPPHGTFYVQRPLPAHLQAGHTLSAESLEEIRTLMRRRDDWIEFYQKKELRDSQRIEELTRYVDTLQRELRRYAPNLPSQGSEPPPGLSPAYLAFRLYRGLPLSMERKMRIKSFLFRRFPALFRNRPSYKNWKSFGE